MSTNESYWNVDLVVYILIYRVKHHLAPEFDIIFQDKLLKFTLYEGKVMLNAALIPAGTTSCF